MKINSSLYIALLFVLISLILPTSSAFAAEDHGCSHAPTIEALRTCVNHAIDAKHIDNNGIGKSLLAKLDAAQAALTRGQTKVAINNLQAFIHAVEAQSGKHILEEHATHMIMHAKQVIDTLSW